MIDWRGDQVMDEITERINKRMIQAATIVVNKAVQYAPKKTGQLALSIGFDYNLSTHTIVFTVGMPYGIFQEYGTRNISPHPYLRPAINEVMALEFGYQTEMAFENVPHIQDPLLAQGAKFHATNPSALTDIQKSHIRRNLVPVSKRLYKGNVSRTRMHLRKDF